MPTQLIVDHSLAVEYAGFDPDAFEKNRAVEERRNEDRFHFIEWTKTAFKNVDVIPAGNGIMHQINLEKMSPVIQARGGVPSRTPAWAPIHTRPRRCTGRHRHRRRRPGSGNRDARPAFDDAPARHRRGQAHRQASARHHRHRYRPRADRVPAQGTCRRSLGGVLRRGRRQLSIGDRATISNMCPEYGATARCSTSTSRPSSTSN